MKIEAHGLSLELAPVNALDDKDWCRVRVIAEVPNFQATFVAYLQGADLKRFRKQVESLYSNVGNAGEATLTSVESGISLSLCSNVLGGIAGTYRLQGEFLEGGAPTLTGGFQMDQSYCRR